MDSGRLWFRYLCVFFPFIHHRNDQSKHQNNVRSIVGSLTVVIRVEAAQAALSALISQWRDSGVNSPSLAEALLFRADICQCIRSESFPTGGSSRLSPLRGQEGIRL